MKYTLGQAAKATGKAKTTISNAVTKGRLSAVKNEKGEYEIDASELHRVYAPVKDASNMDATPPPSNAAEIDALNAQVAMLQDMLERERAHTDEWRKQAQTLALSAPKETERTLWQKLFGR